MKWKQEPWRIGAWCDYTGEFAIDYKSGPVRAWVRAPSSSTFDRLRKESIDDASKVLGFRQVFKWKPGKSPCRWRSAASMPKWASRSVALSMLDKQKGRKP